MKPDPSQGSRETPRLPLPSERAFLFLRGDPRSEVLEVARESLWGELSAWLFEPQGGFPEFQVSARQAFRITDLRLKDRPELLPTCLSATLLVRHGEFLFLAHLGRGRPLLYRRRFLHPLAQEHTAAFEAYQRGEIRISEVLHHPLAGQVTQGLGREGNAEHPSVEPVFHRHKTRPEDLLIFPGGDLLEALAEEDLLFHLDNPRAAPLQAQELVEAARRLGAEEASVCVLQIDSEGSWNLGFEGAIPPPHAPEAPSHRARSEPSEPSPASSVDPELTVQPILGVLTDFAEPPSRAPEPPPVSEAPSRPGSETFSVSDWLAAELGHDALPQAPTPILPGVLPSAPTGPSLPSFRALEPEPKPEPESISEPEPEPEPDQAPQLEPQPDYASRLVPEAPPASDEPEVPSAEAEPPRPQLSLEEEEDLMAAGPPPPIPFAEIQRILAESEKAATPSPGDGAPVESEAPPTLVPASILEPEPEPQVDPAPPESAPGAFELSEVDPEEDLDDLMAPGPPPPIPFAEIQRLLELEDAKSAQEEEAKPKVDAEPLPAPPAAPEEEPSPEAPQTAAAPSHPSNQPAQELELSPASNPPRATQRTSRRPVVRRRDLANPPDEESPPPRPRPRKRERGSRRARGVAPAAASRPDFIPRDTGRFKIPTPEDQTTENWVVLDEESPWDSKYVLGACLLCCLVILGRLFYVLLTRTLA